MIPKGKLLIVGGHEDKGDIAGENLIVHKKNRPQTHFEILGSLIQKIPRVHHIIEIIAAASAFPQEMDELYINAYKKEGFTKVGFIKIENENDAADTVLIKRVQTAHAVFFTGGDQNKLVALLAGTALLSAIKTKYYADENFIVAGTSAGAMAMSENIIAGGIIAEALYKDDIKIVKGFDFIKNIIIDTHFIKRGRFARLAHAVALSPSCIGIGLGENTALLISSGNNANCIGSGMVVMIDGSKIKHTNINVVDDSKPIYIENLIVSIWVEGCCFKLNDL